MNSPAQVVLPLSCIALAVYPYPPAVIPEVLTDSPKVDEGHLGKIALSLTDLSLIYQEASADMSEYDDDDLREQEKLAKTVRQQPPITQFSSRSILRRPRQFSFISLGVLLSCVFVLSCCACSARSCLRI
jgi:hypothetical protein